MKVNVLDAKNRLSQLIHRAQAGDEIIIAIRGKPVARLVGVRASSEGKTQSGTAQAILEWLERNPLPAHARRSRAEIETAIEEERNAWD